MPKKSASARSTAQRVKPKTQKAFELVRPAQDESQILDEVPEPVAAPAAASLPETAQSSTLSSPVATEISTPSSTAPVSAATRLAARRQSQQRQQQRTVASLITAEHYSYVRKDLAYIAILAVLMLAIIIVLYFVFGVNA